MQRERVAAVGAIPILIAAPSFSYFAMYGPKTVSAVLAVIIALAFGAWLLLRRRPRALFAVSLPLALVAATIPLTHGAVDAVVHRIRFALAGMSTSAAGGPPPVWTTHFADEAPIVELGPTAWPGWRGPRADGRADQAAPATTWSPNSNLIWSSPVPGRGYASPCVIGNFILLATADENLFAQGLLCFDAAHGRLLWASRLFQGRPMSFHPKNSHASATPCSDGRFVYAAFLADHDGRRGIWVSAVDLAGKIQWRRFLQEYHNNEGFASSPALSDGLVIVAADAMNQAALYALDCATGEIRWQANRPAGSSYSSPIVADVAGRRQVVLAANGWLTSYEPATGRELWRASGLPEYCAGSAVYDDTTVYASGGSPDKVLLAVRADGTGDVSKTHVVWRTTTNAPYVPAPLLINDRLYVTTDNGVFACLNKADGKTAWRTRLSGDFSASPTWAGDRIYVPNEDGKMYVLVPDEGREPIAENELSAGGMATPAFCGDRIYLRTFDELICIQAAATGDETGERKVP